VYLFDLFRSFLPLRNPIGFGAADFLVFAIALLLTAALIARAALLPLVRRLADSTPAAMVALAAMALLLRLALLGSSPAPPPAGADDFSYVLLADTLRHLRFANPPHPLSQFFEAVFILQRPTYSSIFPPGQGIALALGKVFLGTYWAGVLITGAGFAALCYWMLRAWVGPRWAFVGGLLAVLQFGPLSSWTNSYWGGFVSACAGCLVFGALPRSGRRAALLLGAGLALELIARPFEFVLLLLCVTLYAVFFMPKRSWPQLLFALPLPLLAFGFMLIQNRSVTGQWTTLPYMLSRHQYGVPTSFTFQRNPVPHKPLTPEQEFDYLAQAAIHGSAPDSPSQFFARFRYRLRNIRFFLLPPLFLSVAWAIANIQRERRAVLTALGAIAIFLIGSNFYPYFFPHYIAAAACLFLLLAVVGLSQLARANRFAAICILCLCAAHFCFWYALHLSNNPALRAATEFESWDFINHGDPEGRLEVTNTLAESPGEHLVFVRYSPQHRFGEWIANAADIDRAHVVWALDLGAVENQKLEQYYPRRQKWLLKPDTRPVQLRPYPAE
jgi:hypothetical protein